MVIAMNLPGSFAGAAIAIVADQRGELVAGVGGVQAGEDEVAAGRGGGVEDIACEWIGWIVGVRERVPDLDLGDDRPRLGGERRRDLRGAGGTRDREVVEIVGEVQEHVGEAGRGGAGGQRVGEHDDAFGAEAAPAGAAEADRRIVGDGDEGLARGGAPQGGSQGVAAVGVGVAARRARGRGRLGCGAGEDGRESERGEWRVVAGDRRMIP